MKSRLYVIHIITLLSVVVLLQGCKKNENRTAKSVEGKVIAAYVGGNVSSANVTLFKQEISTGTITGIYREVGSTTTDANGYYKIDFDRTTVLEFRIEVEHEDHFFYSKILDPESVFENSSFTFNPEIDSKSFLAIHIFDQNGDDSQGQFTYGPRTELNCFECCPKENIVFQGSVDTTIYCNAIGGTEYEIGYNLIKNNGTHVNKVESYTCVPYETTFIELGY